MRRTGCLVLSGVAWLVLAAPAIARPDPCDPGARRLFCEEPAISGPVCSALASSERSAPAGTAVDRLVAAAAEARRVPSPGAQLDGSRLLACRLIELGALEQSGAVLRSALDSMLPSIAATTPDTAVLPPLAYTMILLARSGFEPDLERTSSTFDQIAAYGDSENTVFARGIAAQGFAALGRTALAERHIDSAVATALTLPERSGDRPPRLQQLWFVVQSEVEAGMWDRAARDLPRLTAAAAIIDEMPATDDERDRARRGLDELRRAVDQRKWPPRP